MQILLPKLVNANDAGQRLDNYLIRTLKGVPKSHIYRIIRAGEVRVNKKRAKPSVKLINGDLVRIPPIRTSQTPKVQINDNLKKILQTSIIAEDQNLIVLNKPAKLAVHGGSGINLGVIELLRKIRYDLPYLELAHRLDRDTSGCLLIAKKRNFLRKLNILLAEHGMEKTYWALLTERWQKAKKLTVNAALQKKILKSGERIVVITPQGKASVTHFRLLKNYQAACWVEALPQTGRTHQIRVHSAHLGHPICGDRKYGQNQDFTNLSLTNSRLYLHARKLKFTVDGHNYCFVANLDQKFNEILAKLDVEH